MFEKAVEKINEELKSFKGGNKESAVKAAVAAALKDFAKQDDEFAQAIVQADKTLADCCVEVMKGVGSSISDIEVYRRAVQFYFKGADVAFHMTISLCPDDQPAENSKPSGIKLNLADFFK